MDLVPLLGPPAEAELHSHAVPGENLCGPPCIYLIFRVDQLALLDLLDENLFKFFELLRPLPKVLVNIVEVVNRFLGVLS